MPQEAMIVALSAIGPIIGSGIGALRRPTTVYIHIAVNELMPAARNSSGGQKIFFFIFGIIAVMLLEIVA